MSAAACHWRPVPVAAVCSVGLLLVACSQPESSPTPPVDGSIVVQPVVDGHLDLRASGRASDPAPVAVRPPVPWLPIEEHVADAVPVAAGEPLVAMSLEVLELWMRDRALDLALERQRLAEQRLDTRVQQEELLERRRDLEADIAVREARIAASRQRDAEELRLAELQVAEAQRRLAERRQELAGVRERFERGLASQREVDQALRALARAELATELPAVRLAILRDTTGATTRYEEGLQLAKLRLELGDDASTDGGIMHRLEVLGELRDRRAAESSDKMRRLQRDQERDQAASGDRYIRAPSDGVAVHPETGLRVGQRLSPAAVAYIYDAEVGTLRFPVDERWRDLVQVDDAATAGGSVRVAVPALDRMGIPGRITKVVTIDGNLAEGRPRQTLGEVRLLDEVPGLRDGMRVDIALQVPCPPEAGWLPLWCLADLRRPAVVLADGSRRAIAGRVVGDRFLVTAGLAVGEAVRLPAQPPAAGERIAGSVEATEVVQLEGRPWRTTLVEMVPDGTAVEPGDVVARFASSRGETPAELLDEAAAAESAARTSFAIARIEADRDVAQAAVDWRQAVLDHRAAAFEHLLARYGSYDESETEARVAERRARLALAEAEELRQRRCAPANVANVSALDLAGAERDVRRAELRLARARLDTAAAFRQRPWRQLRQLAHAEADALDRARNQRQRLTEQRFRFRIQLERARERFQRDLRQARRDRRYAERLVLRAPVAGQVYRRWNGWGPLRVGERLHVQYPFFIPTGDAREVVFEMPAETYGRYRAGDRVAVVVPLLGEAPVPATVTAVNENFRLPRGAIEEIVIRGNAGLPSKVYSITVRLDIDAAAARRCTPGVTAWLEVAG